MNAKHDNRAWRDFWKENRLAACVPDNPRAAEEIEAGWRQFFCSLPANTRVLDIATGNGVLLVWAAAAAKHSGHSLRLTGIDLADIDPAKFLPGHRELLEGVEFLGGISAEQLPFDDGSFDVVVSQYGMEYAELSPALAEAARVLPPTGRLHWLAHSDASVVVEQGRDTLEDIALLLNSHGPFHAMQDFITAWGRGRKVQRSLAQLTEALKRAEQYCAAHPQAKLVRQLAGAILATANGMEKYRPDDTQRWLDENRRRLEAQQQRLGDLQAACLSPPRKRDLQKLLDDGPWTDTVMSDLMLGSEGESAGLLIQATRS